MLARCQSIVAMMPTVADHLGTYGGGTIRAHCSEDRTYVGDYL